MHDDCVLTPSHPLHCHLTDTIYRSSLHCTFQRSFWHTCVGAALFRNRSIKAELPEADVPLVHHFPPLPPPPSLLDTFGGEVVE